MTQTTPSTSAQGPDDLAKRITDAASAMCEIARIADDWRHGPKQSLTAINEISACLTASTPPAASPASPSGDVPLTIDALAQEIRRVDGNHSLGAGALAEAILPFITRAIASLASDATPAPTSGSEATCNASLQVAAIPRAENTGRYLAETNDGRLLYLNHANQWQEMPNILAKPASEPAGGDVDFPMGAIENGRAFADRLEVTGLECEAGKLSMCSDWQEFRRCFDWLAQWALERAALAQIAAPGAAMEAP